MQARQAQIDGDYEAALRGYRGAVVKIGCSTGFVPSRLWFEVGVCERAVGAHEKAVDAFERAIEANTLHQESVVWLARLGMARALEDLGLHKEADAALEPCINELSSKAADSENVNWKLERLAVTQDWLRKCRAKEKSTTGVSR
ncbi:hypothetical protein HAHE_41130 [Haloferula helveola]|uniref:Tetratricopeptide repeat-containing protein n=1 Tax=Haloferula helveola TaxID=490095 RepID=A0ABM7RRV8_9BACT|nr:hypothetical protein HAHE_41130 [Haloferula helveola]